MLLLLLVGMTDVRVAGVVSVCCVNPSRRDHFFTALQALFLHHGEQRLLLVWFLWLLVVRAKASTTEATTTTTTIHTIHNNE